MRIDVLGVGFDNLTMDEAVARGMELLQSPGTHYAATPNPEIVEMCRKNLAARQAVNGADLVLPDGVGVVMGAKMLGTPLKERVPGIEFAAGLMERMGRHVPLPSGGQARRGGGRRKKPGGAVPRAENCRDPRRFF